MLDQRLSAEQRREAIVRAALPLFARKGFANTTTRELADAAGVSEALLYKHFPSKESLYAEIQNTGCKDKDHGLEKLASVEPSTSALVHIVYYLLRTIVMGKPGDTISWETKHRMILNSCLEDGEFTRVHHCPSCDILTNEATMLTGSQGHMEASRPPRQLFAMTWTSALISSRRSGSEFQNCASTSTAYRS